MITQDVVDAMRMPSDSELMKRSLSDLDQNFSLEIGIRSLYELLELIEPIDNSIGTILFSFISRGYRRASFCNKERLLISLFCALFFTDFVKLGGLSIIDSCLNHSESEIRVLALWVLGVASQNNPFVQNKVRNELFPSNFNFFCSISFPFALSDSGRRYYIKNIEFFRVFNFTRISEGVIFSFCLPKKQ